MAMEDLQILDRNAMLKAFDETQAGVKGLLDSGIRKLPRIFVRPPNELSEELTHKKSQIQVPVVDLDGFQDPDRRRHIVEEVRDASKTWGFFQVVNHGIPQSVLDGIIDATREFNEQDVEMKKKYYSRDITKAARFNCNHDLFMSRTANWRDTLSFSSPGSGVEIDRDELPPPCRESVPEYSRHMEILGNVLLGLLSEALGLQTGHLEEMECSNGHRLHCHYYPVCPEPDLAIGVTKHTDPGFLTILLQNQITGGLQVLHQGQWIDIRPTPRGLVVNIGDLLQLVSNGTFESNVHRAIATRDGPRISVACFFSGPIQTNKIYGPIQELISKENPAVYREVVVSEHIKKFTTTGLDSYRALDYYKL